MPPVSTLFAAISGGEIGLLITVVVVSNVFCQPTIIDDSSTCSSVEDDVWQLTDQLRICQHKLNQTCGEAPSSTTPGTSDCPSPAGSPLNSDLLVNALTSMCIPLMIQQNVNGSNFFNRSWAEFRAGFNDSSGNYWLGTETIHQLTKSGQYKLRFDLHARGIRNTWLWAEYSTFIVQDESQAYRMHISGFTGNAGDDALAVHSGMKFTTYDSDNDLWDGSTDGQPYNHNCAVWNSAGFWYRHCSLCDVNGYRGSSAYGFRWVGLNAQGDNRLESSRMWLTCHR